jgi:hypothetical protein
VSDERAARDTLELLQVEVRTLRAALAQADDKSMLEPLVRERDALQVQLAHVQRELADLEGLRALREQQRKAEMRETEELQEKERELVDALSKVLVTGLAEPAPDDDW